MIWVDRHCYLVTPHFKGHKEDLIIFALKIFLRVPKPKMAFYNVSGSPLRLMTAKAIFVVIKNLVVNLL